MKKTIKILSILMLCCIFVSAFSIIALGASNIGNEITPLYDNVLDPTINITQSGGTCYVTARVTRITGTTNMDGTVVIYEKINGEWSEIDTWTKSTTRATLSITPTFTVVTGREYKVDFTIVATSPTSVETIQTSSEFVGN